MKRWWPREVLRFVDAWACREGTPEDDEDERERDNRQHEGEVGAGHEQGGGDGFFPPEDIRNELSTVGESRKNNIESEIQVAGSSDAGNDWIELDVYPQADEEIGRKGR